MTTPVRVERALRLLPRVDVMEPVRALLVATPRHDDDGVWASAAPYLTIGKHSLDIDAVRQRVNDLVPRVASHLAAVYGAYSKALGAAARNDGAGIVAALGEGGAAEEQMSRSPQAAEWYEVALAVAGELHERGPEIAMLNRLGGVAHGRARFDDAARYYQRALVLAEGEFDHEGTIVACLGLGRASLARNALPGARAWLLRALRQAEGAHRPEWIGVLEHEIGALLWRQGETAPGFTRLLRAREELESVGAHAELARLLCTIARCEIARGHRDDGLAAVREALAWSQRPNADDRLRIQVPVEAADLYMECGMLLDAEHELRRAETIAIDLRVGERLIEVYVAMGRLAGIRSDETGFVFFEQAAELCRAFAPISALEGRLYEEYGYFRQRFGARDEANAHLDRARQIYDAAGDLVSAIRVRRNPAEEWSA